MNKKTVELDYMNAIACLLVILIHVLSVGIERIDTMSWQSALIYFPWRIAAFVVPLFLYTGAVKMAMQFENKRVTGAVYLRYALRRIKKIFLPYAVWVCIYYFCFLAIGYVEGGVGEFFSYLFSGSLAAPFYYVIIIMQFYLLMPLWVWVMRRVPFYLSLAVSLLIWFFLEYYPDITWALGISFPYGDRIFLTYIVFWVLGLYAGKNYDRTLEMLTTKKWDKVVCIALILIYAWIYYIRLLGYATPFDILNVKLIADVLSILVLHFIAVSLLSAHELIKKTLSAIYRSSFFVFLAHSLFLTAAQRFLDGQGIVRLSAVIGVRALVCYSVPFILYFIWSRIKAAAGKDRFS
ncbi:MAG: acyltransferase [Clostridia bacterium]|nr:acyltransferase [Clostridia bacterium]